MRMNTRLWGLIGGDITAKALTFLSLAWLTRMLGDRAYGQIAWTQAIVGYLSIPADMGFAALGARELAKAPETFGWYVRRGLLLRGLSGLLIVGAVLLTTRGFMTDDVLAAILVASSLWLIPSMLGLEWALQGAFRTDLVGVVRFTTSLGFVLSVWMWSLGARNTPSAAGCRAAAECAGLCASLFLACRLARRAGSATGLSCGRCLVQSFPLMTANLVSSLYSANFDIILLGLFWPHQDVGWYAVAFRLYLMLSVLPKLVNVYYYPKLSQAAARGTSELQDAWLHLCSTSARLALPLISLTMVLAPEIVLLFHGPSYAAAVPLLRILGAGAIPLLFCAGMPSLLIAANETRGALICLGTALCVSLTFNILLIPTWGSYASAWAVVASETTVLVVGIWMIRRRVGVRLPSPALLLGWCIPSAIIFLGGMVFKRALSTLTPMHPFAVAAVIAAFAFLVSAVSLRGSLRKRAENGEGHPRLPNPQG
jgi:O-antigen/teichoic acid export membrane protein